MHVNCPHCGARGQITSSKLKSEADRDIYVNCTNYEACNARVLFKLEYSHDLRAPDGEQFNSLEEQIARMDPQRRAELLFKYNEPRLSAFG